MKIATWNVNSIKARLEPALAWLKAANPDVVCLQEIKCVDENFPREAFESLGYNCAVHGQKSYNGVAILSKRPIEDVTPRLPAPDGVLDDHSRYLEAVITGDKGVVRVASIYAPNGNPQPGPKFDYKLAWLERLRIHARKLLRNEEAVVLMGDYNIIPEDKDAAKPKNWLKDALFQPESKAAYRRLLNLGYMRRLPRQASGRRPLYLLGLFRLLGAQQRHSHRSHPAVAAGDRPAEGRWHRQGRARRQREAIRPRSCLGRA